MKGDFTRSTFNKRKHYRKVNAQQGRVQMDADWNEQNDIQSYREQKFLLDLVGKSGTLDQDNGFKILENFSFSWNKASTNDSVKLRKFLQDNFNLPWISDNEPPVTVSPNGNTITISAADGSHKATITRGVNNDASLDIDDTKGVYSFILSGNVVRTRGYLIGRGNYYVDGILCENESDIEATRQPDLVLSDRPMQFRIFEWESADSQVTQYAIAGFVSSVFPEMIGVQMSVAKNSSTTITISDKSNATIATIELVINDGTATLKSISPSRIVHLTATKNANGNTVIYYPLENPSLPEPLPSTQYYLAYLDTWDLHVTYLDDPYIREKALGGVDTATRTKTAWQVKLEQVKSIKDKCQAWKIVSDLASDDSNTNTGKMQVRAEPSPDQTDICQLYETAGYRGLENHLYRVEVHNGAKTLAESTFKWQRDNGIVVSAVTNFRPLENKVEIQNRGRDDNLDFKQDTWIEITDDIHERLGLPGTLVKVKEVKEKVIEYYPDTIIGPPIIADNFSHNPKTRRWDSNGVIKGSDVVDYLDLEDGIQIFLTEGQYKTGKYWIFPARANSTESIEWPRVGDKPGDQPLAMLPKGIDHHYAPLAILQHDKQGNFAMQSDLRSFFFSLADLLSIHYAGGDGQQALPNDTLAQPLRVSVTLGRTPIHNTPLGKAKVRFSIVKPSVADGILFHSSDKSLNGVLEIETDEEGLASCYWTLAEGKLQQQVKAELVGYCGSDGTMLMIPPIYFSASQPISFYYVEGDGSEAGVGQTINLSAGVAVGGRKPLGSPSTTDKYEVKFSIVTSGGGTLSQETVNVINGIATTTYTISSSVPQQQQIKAELQLNGQLANLPPIYFNVGVTHNAGASANTGLLELMVSESLHEPWQYGPFNHYLTCTVPPAILLGQVRKDDKLDSDIIKRRQELTKQNIILVNDFKKRAFNLNLSVQEKGYLSVSQDQLFDDAVSVSTRMQNLKVLRLRVEAIHDPTNREFLTNVINKTEESLKAENTLLSKYEEHYQSEEITETEDYGIIVQGIRYKPVNITTSTFMVHVWKEINALIHRQSLHIRWYAIPGQNQKSQHACPNFERTLTVSPNTIPVGSAFNFEINDPCANRDIGSIDAIPVHITSTSDPVGLRVMAQETQSNTNIFRGTVRTSANSILGIDVKPGDTINIIYKFGSGGEHLRKTIKVRKILTTDTNVLVMNHDQAKKVVEITLSNANVVGDTLTVNLASIENVEKGIPITLKRVPSTNNFSVKLKVDLVKGEIKFGSKTLSGLKPGTNLTTVYKTPSGQAIDTGITLKG